MSKTCMTQIETIAVLLNGGHIVWRQPSCSGSSSYRVYLPGGSRPDKHVGRLNDSVISSLWKAGFLEQVSPCRTDKSGDRLCVLKLSKPKLPFFVLDDLGEVPGDE